MIPGELLIAWGPRPPVFDGLTSSYARQSGRATEGPMRNA